MITEQKQVLDKLNKVFEKQFEKNTLGVRLLNTLVNQYFINGGEIPEKSVESSSFQTTLSLKGTK